MNSAEANCHELMLYTLAHKNPTFIHQYVVDAYAAQTATEKTKPITITFALIGLYLYIEKGNTGKAVQRAHIQLAKNRKDWPLFPLPKSRGKVTVSDVIKVTPGPEREAMIKIWCASAWEAYREVHAQVADLVYTELRKS